MTLIDGSGVVAATTTLNENGVIATAVGLEILKVGTREQTSICKQFKAAHTLRAALPTPSSARSHLTLPAHLNHPSLPRPLAAGKYNPQSMTTLCYDNMLSSHRLSQVRDSSCNPAGSGSEMGAARTKWLVWLTLAPVLTGFGIW